MQLAGAPAQFVPDPRDEAGLAPGVAMACRAAAEALRDAGLDLSQCDRDRAGCVVGSSKGSLASFARFWQGERHGHRAESRYESHGTSAVSVGIAAAPPQRVANDLDERAAAELWNQFLPHQAASEIARRFDLRGAAVCPVAACATGLLSIVQGADLISRGHCDTVLAGSSDQALQKVLCASYRRLGVLASGFENPATACRPYDRQRNGFLIGEGAAILVLERYDQALARGRKPYAEWIAAGMAADPSGMTRVEREPRGLARLITDVLRRGGVAPDELDYINLHGTATRDNDLCETRALKSALGGAARKIASSSLKGTMGHLLGAAGSVELAATLLALRDGCIPPTANLTDPDPECDLDYTPLVARHRPLQTALKLSLGFGGHLAAAIVRSL
jgi:3-oxoacyl-(acyl-carrier-protein) synthase